MAGTAPSDPAPSAAGGALARSGVDVVLVARGEHARVLSEKGLTLRTPDDTYQIPVSAAGAPEEIRLTDRDVLVFATKTHQLDAALQQWADQPVHNGDNVIGTAGELLPVLTALNGVVAEEMALRFFARVFGVCVWTPAAYVTPGEVIAKSWPVAAQFHIARWPAALGTDEDRVLLADIAEAWTPAGVLVKLPPDAAPWKYNKLLSNLANAVVALTGSMSAAQKQDALLKIVSGEADIVVGTHALIQDSVDSFQLGLVVVDEEQRFGVEHKEKLKAMRTDVTKAVAQIRAAQLGYTPDTVLVNPATVSDLLLLDELVNLSPREDPNRNPLFSNELANYLGLNWAVNDFVPAGTAIVLESRTAGVNVVEKPLTINVVREGTRERDVVIASRRSVPVVDEPSSVVVIKGV